MNKSPIVLIIVSTLLAISACSDQSILSENKAESQVLEFKDIEWADLEPQGEAASPQYPSHGAASFEEDSAYGSMGAGIAGRYMGMNPHYSSGVVAEMDGKAVRIPGFMVPIEFDKNLVTEFFLVPYFGACYHTPPPPPNQIIFVESQDGVEFDSIYDPVWLNGVIATKKKDNEIATAEYTLTLSSLEPYSY